MKILEIARPSTISQAKRVLKGAGYDQIGDGRFALVFAKYGDPYVLKLFSNSDAGYTWFYNYAVTHPSKHFPKFKGVLLRVTNQYSAIRTERLSELADGEASDRIEAVLDDISYAAEKGRTSINLSDYTLVDDEFINVTLKLARDAIAGGFGLDLTRYNVMMRGPVCVITDPVLPRYLISASDPAQSAA